MIDNYEFESISAENLFNDMEPKLLSDDELVNIVKYHEEMPGGLLEHIYAQKLVIEYLTDVLQEINQSMKD